MQRLLPIALGRQPLRRLVGQGPDGAQGMTGWVPGFQVRQRPASFPEGPAVLRMGETPANRGVAILSGNCLKQVAHRSFPAPSRADSSTFETTEECLAIPPMRRGRNPQR